MTVSRSSVDAAKLRALGFEFLEEVEEHAPLQACFDRIPPFIDGGRALFITARAKEEDVAQTLVFDVLSGHIWKAEGHLRILRYSPHTMEDATRLAQEFGEFDLRLQVERASSCTPDED